MGGYGILVVNYFSCCNCCRDMVQKTGGGFLTPKAIGNRIKAKGLQKLRWYCQMCQKQCRDENGFKCHCLSETHQRQMLLFRDDSGKYMDSFSQEFEDAYVEIIRRKRNARLKANVVYQELVGHRQHIHMNSTKWETLTSFIQYLGKKGVATVDLTPKGWFIKYIDKNPETIRRQEAVARKEANALDEEERATKMIQEQMERARQIEGTQLQNELPDAGLDDAMADEGDCYYEGDEGDDEPGEGEIARDEEAKISMEFKKPAIPTSVLGPLNVLSKKSVFQSVEKVDDELERVKESSVSSSTNKTSSKPEKRKISAMEQIVMETEARKKREKERDDLRLADEQKKIEEEDVVREDWLFFGLVVKVMNKSLAGGKFYKQKGKIIGITNTYLAEVSMIDSSDVIKIDQEELETVIPALDKPVMLVNGRHRGRKGVLVGLDKEAFSARVRLTDGEHKGLEVKGIAYEHLCKIDS